MITPRFSCNQNETSVIISIYCPSIRATDVEINVDDTLVSIHVNPYYLRLNFSKPLIEDDLSSAKYDPSSGYLTVTLTKELKGEVFNDLDLLAKLLAPRPSTSETPTIEVLSSEATPSTDDLAEEVKNLSIEHDEILEAAENDWQIPQTLPEESGELLPQKYYGFLEMYTGYLKHATHTENEINELGDKAEVYSRKERRRTRVKHEDEKWDEEYYMADFMDDENIQELLRWKFPHLDDTSPVEFTEQENMAMLRLPCKEYLATPTQTRDLYLTLSTLLFSYFYDAQTTQHDPTPESAWTICALTPSFSALDPPNSHHHAGKPFVFTTDELQEMLIPSYRRVLAFPLYRSFAMAERCQQDTGLLLQRGKRMVLRCLLEIKDLLDHHEVYYIYGKLWVDDFCVWIQKDASDDVLKELGRRLMEVKVDKDVIGWGLRQLEKTAQEALERESDSDDESD